MTDLEQLSGPRDEKIVQRFARRVEPTYGFVAYGVLYLCLSSFALAFSPSGRAFVTKAHATRE